jgi:ABC-type arginine transport system permease subunit
MNNVMMQSTLILKCPKNLFTFYPICTEIYCVFGSSEVKNLKRKHKIIQEYVGVVIQLILSSKILVEAHEATIVQ